MSELVRRRIIRPWFHPDAIYRLSKEGKRHAECLSILHGFTNKVRTVVCLSVCLSHWLQYSCQGVQHNLHQIVLKLSLNLISLYDGRHISCVCPSDVILTDIYGLFSGQWQCCPVDGHIIKWQGITKLTYISQRITK